MTKVYFVRHAQPIHSWEDDRTRPLTEDGANDSKQITKLLTDIPIDVFISSPYKRSIDTIAESALCHGMEIIIDERFRERKVGICNNNIEMIRKRWADFDFCEQDGETINLVQKRNMEALLDILFKYQEKEIVIGTHGTALSTILNYYDSTYGCEDFLRMIGFMPYVIRLDFDGFNFLEKEELLIINHEYL